MTIKTEYRWVCDLCGAVSPPIAITEKPHGWLEIAWAILEYGGATGPTGPWHFCSEAHKLKWQIEEQG
jgi:hypothetical protein